MAMPPPRVPAATPSLPAGPEAEWRAVVADLIKAKVGLARLLTGRDAIELYTEMAAEAQAFTTPLTILPRDTVMSMVRSLIAAVREKCREANAAKTRGAERSATGRTDERSDGDRSRERSADSSRS